MPSTIARHVMLPVSVGIFLVLRFAGEKPSTTLEALGWACVWYGGTLAFSYFYDVAHGEIKTNKPD